MDDDVSSMFAASTDSARPTKEKQQPPKLVLVKNEPDPIALAKVAAAREELLDRQEAATAAAGRLAEAEEELARAERNVASARNELEHAQEAADRAERALRDLD
jgi:chromosome segregation ATPase